MEQVEDYFKAKNKKLPQSHSKEEQGFSEEEYNYFNFQRIRLTSHHDGLFLPELIARLEIN